MESQQARVSVSFKDGVIEISGPENFVSEQVKVFRDIIGQQFSILSGLKTQAGKDGVVFSHEATPKENSSDNKTPSPLYSEKLGRITILKHVPGGDREERILNTAVVYLWIKTQTGVSLVPIGEIREACNQQQCLDKSNFAKIIKKGTRYYSVTGSPRTYQLELNENGKEYVRELLSHMN